jgi:hypothetical protein
MAHQNTTEKYYLIGTNATANYSYPVNPPCDGCGTGKPHLFIAAADATSRPGEPVVDNNHSVKHPVYGGVGKWGDIETGVKGPFDSKDRAEDWLNGRRDSAGTTIHPPTPPATLLLPEFAFRYTNIVCVCVSVA